MMDTDQSSSTSTQSQSETVNVRQVNTINKTHSHIDIPNSTQTSFQSTQIHTQTQNFYNDNDVAPFTVLFEKADINEIKVGVVLK